MVKKPLKSLLVKLLVLVLIAVVMAPLGIYLEENTPPQDPGGITTEKTPVGSTIFAGMQVIDKGKIRKSPLPLHLDYIIEDFKGQCILDGLYSLLTCTVSPPIDKISEGVEPDGKAANFTGPGMLTVKGNKLVVKPPANFVWAYKTPYTYGVKTENGLEIVEKNRTVKVIAPEDINNQTTPVEYLNATTIKEWYKKAKVGDRIALDFSLSNFSDGRREVPPSDIVKFFGENTKKYMKEYPAGSPVMAYMHNYRIEEVSSGVSALESYPEYDDISREYNAREFIKAWNGTIIPPGAISSGKETVTFTSSRDPKAPGGYASHGTCPPARALRDAVAAAGLPTPTGITWGHFALMYGFNPTLDVKVHNTGDHPIMIIMWATGSGPGTIIYAKVIRLIPV